IGCIGILIACSESPEKKAYQAIDEFLNEKVADYKSIEVIRTYKDSLYCDFETAKRIALIQDSIAYYNKKGEDLQRLLEAYKSVGAGPSEAEIDEFGVIGTNMKRLAGELEKIADSEDFQTDYFTIYYFFRHNRNHPTLEHLTFYFDGQGTLLGYTDLDVNPNRIYDIPKRSDK
ncbi:MAG: hypothetical protein LUE93_13960, partial [Bacteroides sp.]|nr:hypothetical protein [Bacteroides sp.]